MSKEQTLNTRATTYGTFAVQATLSQTLQNALRSHDLQKWASLSPSQKDALTMICVKLSRIVNGDPNYPDSWHDIAGYAELIENELNGILK